MANRMVVIPEEVYDSLMSSRGSVLSDPLDAKLVDSSNNMSRILSDRGKNATEKFARYDQQLKEIRSLAKRRQEHSSGLNLQDVLSQLVSQLQLSINPLKVPAQPAISELPTLPDPGLLARPDPTAPSVLQKPSSTVANGNQTVEAKPKSSIKAGEITELGVKKQPPIAPPIPKHLRPVKKTQAMEVEASQPPDSEMGDASVFNTIRARVMANPSAYGVSDKGKIIRPGGRSYFHSSLDESLSHLLGNGGGTAPAGTYILRENLMDDPEIAKILPQVRNEVSSTKSLIKKYWYMQDNKDRRATGHSLAKNAGSSAFRPALWEIKREPSEADMDPSDIEDYRPTAKETIAKQKKKEADRKLSLDVKQRRERPGHKERPKWK